MIPCPLTTFVLNYALARGALTSGLLVTTAMAVGMIATIRGNRSIAAFMRDRLVRLLARSEGWRAEVRQSDDDLSTPAHARRT